MSCFMQDQSELNCLSEDLMLFHACGECPLVLIFVVGKLYKSGTYLNGSRL